MKKKVISLSILISVIVICFICILYCKQDKIPKYVFLFIGDGMSSAQVELTEIYHNSIENKEHSKQELLSFTSFPVIGLRKNYSYSNYITDSAASATVLSTGTLTYNGAINVDMNGNELIPITYELKNNYNRKIGIITTNSINHATPSGFFGSANNRKEYDNLAIDLVKTNFDFYAGGTVQLNNLKIKDFYDEAKKNHFNIIDNEDKLKNINNKNKNIVISPYATSDGYVPFALDHYSDFNFENYVKTAINVLDNKNGFFIMAESGLIDTAGHHNDARSVIAEVEELDKGVKVALEFAKKHPKDTLIIVTGDHETGGLSLGKKGYNLKVDNLQTQKYSYSMLIQLSKDIRDRKVSYPQMLKYLEENYGIKNISFKGIYQQTKKGNTEVLYKKIMELKDNESYIEYTTTSHSADRIPVYAYGIGSEKFASIFKMEDFNSILRSIVISE